MHLEVNGPERSCNFTTLCICVSIVREKSINYSLFTSVCKVQHCTGYPLIQVEIVSVCKSHYLRWLASQSSLLTSLFLECVVVFRLFSSVGAGAGAGIGAGPSAGASSTMSAISAFSSFLSEKYRIRHRRSIWCCHVDKVR